MARRLPIVEFIALMAMLFSMVAFAIDAMLPGLPEIASELTPHSPNQAQLVITAFMFGMGAGTFLAGPLADAYGRRFITNLGILVFAIGALMAYLAPTLELLLAARLLQGVGVAGPRIAPLAMVRDIYEGRKMAQITSFITMVFMLVPAAAPSVGALIMDQWNWRGIFLAFIVFAAIAAIWLNLRQDETLANADRRPFSFKVLQSGFVEIVTNRSVVIYTAIMTLAFSTLIAQLSSTQQIYDLTFGRQESFPLWFALTALFAVPATFLNAMLVVRVGMRRMAMFAFGMQAVVSLGIALIFLIGQFPWATLFPVWFIWSTANLFTAGLTLGNLQALALQPLGHIAGFGASVTIASSTILAVFIGGPIGLLFNGTPVPLVICVGILATLAWAMIRRLTQEL